MGIDMSAYQCPIELELEFIPAAIAHQNSPPRLYNFLKILCYQSILYTNSTTYIHASPEEC